MSGGVPMWWMHCTGYLMVCVCMGQTKQGTSASEGHRAASINGGGGDGGGQNVDIVGLTCRSDGWAEGK